MARGQLRIYLGAAPGVGKTYAMLDEGWRRAHRGTDVVVGYLETHGRRNTEGQIRDLTVIPRRVVEYRGQAFDEMDIDAVLERRPAVALVDELAHTNVPGSRNEKRWQDVDELLDAGIDVISTVNIQHLESLNDVVEGITGVQQRETIPDAIVREADQVELVDMTPEALRRRMAHGNIYKPEKVDAALGHYFRVGNLSALRELALLWMADTVDEALQEYRQRHGISRGWETRERVLVAITGAPGGADLIRRAARMAMRARGELIGVHVVADDGLRGDTGASEAVRDLKALLEEVGGRYLEVAGSDVALALVQVAHAENATQVVIGASQRSRWSELLRRSVVMALIRGTAGTIDVHVISRADDAPLKPQAAPIARSRRLAGVSARRQTLGFAFTLIGLPLMTVVLSHVRESMGLQNVLLTYLLAVVLIAAIGGVWPALIASIVAFLLLNWFFAPPLHTFTIGNVRDALALSSFLVIAGVVSVLVDLAARRRIAAARAHTEARTLATMAGTVLDDPDPLPRLAEQLRVAFGIASISLLVAGPENTWTVEASAGPEPPLTPNAAERTLATADGAVLAWNGGELHAEERDVLASFATQLTLARNRHALQRQAARAAVLADANELRDALLAAVSHDLRTPLASIRAAATSLLSDEVRWEPDVTKELLQTIDDEAERLNNLVGNLLDMSRLQTGAVPKRLQPVGLEEVVASALASLHPGLGKVAVDVPETLPRQMIDPGLFERAVANLVDNALAFSPEGVPVRVEAAQVADSVYLRIIDCGPGIPVADRERVFQPFQRLGDNPNGLGVGLGLAVAKGFVEACGGELVIEDTPGGGCTMVIALPLGAR